MSFPGTYNIKYYKGDTFEFRIYPKDSAGNDFSLTNFTLVNFTIAEQQGDYAGRVPIEAYARIDGSGYILCAIRAEDGAKMTAGTTYVYDVQIYGSSSPYSYTYTLLTGTISVTEQVTLPLPLETAPPNQPGSLLASDQTSTSIKLTWSAPTSGQNVDGYKLAVFATPGDPSSIIGSPIILSSTTLNYTVSALTHSTTYGFAVVAYNDAGDSTPSATTGTTLIAPPNTPGPITFGTITSTSVQINWTAPTGGTEVTAYTVAVVSNPLDPLGSILATDTVLAGTTTYTFSGLTPATTYGFGVIAVNAGGNSPYSGNFTTTLGT